jgi:hypothetical protein
MTGPQPFSMNLSRGRRPIFKAGPHVRMLAFAYARQGTIADGFFTGFSANISAFKPRTNRLARIQQEFEPAHAKKSEI